MYLLKFVKMKILFLLFDFCLFVNFFLFLYDISGSIIDIIEWIYLVFRILIGEGVWVVNIAIFVEIRVY